MSYTYKCREICIYIERKTNDFIGYIINVAFTQGVM